MTSEPFQTSFGRKPVMKKFYVLSLFSILLFSNCDLQQPLGDEDLIYLGEWSSDDYFIEIAANGYGFCQRRNRPSFEGNVTIRNNRIIIQGEEGRHRFDIDEPPFEEFGEIMMILDGDLFYRH